MEGLGIDHHLHHQHQYQHHGHFAPQQLPSHPPRKRKAEAVPENNERLSKRMSLLNLEQSGQKLYVPVENPSPQLSDVVPKSHHHKHKHHGPDPSQMELDDSKYKVYIYNLDDELSSSDNDETDPETDNGGKLIFLPDIEKHLRNNRRIPAHVLAGPHPPDPAAGWAAGKELVLYREPSSLSVPEEQDSVRKAILEARARAREKQRVEHEQAAAAAAAAAAPPAVMVPVPAMTSSVSLGDVPMDADPLLPSSGEEDPDAMEID